MSRPRDVELTIDFARAQACYDRDGRMTKCRLQVEDWQRERFSSITWHRDSDRGALVEIKDRKGMLMWPFRAGSGWEACRRPLELAKSSLILARDGWTVRQDREDPLEIIARADEMRRRDVGPSRGSGSRQYDPNSPAFRSTPRALGVLERQVALARLEDERAVASKKRTREEGEILDDPI